jgi:hypothetical protein
MTPTRAVHRRWWMSDRQCQGRQRRDGDWVGPVQGERRVTCGGTTRGRDHPIGGHVDEDGGPRSAGSKWGMDCAPR